MSEDFDTAQAAIEAVNALDEAERWRKLAEELAKAAKLHACNPHIVTSDEGTSYCRMCELIGRYREAAKEEK